MHTSYSALDTYKTCPLKYKFQAIDKISAPKSVEAVFGSAIHSSLKFMFERKPLYPTIDEVIDFFADKWTKSTQTIAWKNPEKKEIQEKFLFEEGVKMLKNFYKKNQPWKFNTVELENRFVLTLEDKQNQTTHTIGGIIDRIDKNQETNEYEIIDYKTSKKMPPQESLKNDLQLFLYHMAIAKRWPLFPIPKIKLSLYFLKHNEKISILATMENVKETKQKVLSIIKEIEERKKENNFPPTPGPLCDWCGYKKICPMFSHEYKKQEMPVKSEEEIASAIKEFFEIKETDEKNKKRIAELRNDILAYMKKNNLGRVFGSPGFITKNTQERVSYDMAKVKEILDPIDKWAEILDADAKKLEALLPSLPAKTQEELKKVQTKKQFIVLKQTKK